MSKASDRAVSLSFGSTGGIVGLLVLILLKMCGVTDRLDVIIKQTHTDQSTITAMEEEPES